MHAIDANPMSARTMQPPRIGVAAAHDGRPAAPSQVQGVPETAPCPGPRADEQPLAAIMDWTPVLWLFGALTIAQAATILRLVRRGWPGGIAVNLIVAAWICIGVAQAAASLINGVLQNVVLTGLRNVLSLTVLGWIFGGLAVAAGAAHRLDDARMVRATTRLGLYVLILAASAAVLEHLLHRPYIAWFNTPVALLLPHCDVRIFYASVQLYLREQTFGDKLVRLVLFFPWTTGLGLGGLGIFFISLLDCDRRWRLLGMAGGLSGIVFSWSRIAQIALLLSVAILLLLRATWRWRILLLCAAGIVLLTLPLIGIDPLAQIGHARGAVDSERAGSSFARELIYQRSWEGFLQSPIIGWGWIGPSVHAKEILPIGSHSTLYGTLYTGGLLTFCSFAVTMLLTLVSIALRLLATAPRTAERRRVEIGFVLLVCLLAYSPVEALYSLTLPCCFLLTFLGGTLAPGPRPMQISRPAAIHRRSPPLPLAP